VQQHNSKRARKRNRSARGERPLTVGQVLRAPAFVRSQEVRSVSPALVIVLEREAPLRIETLATNDAEFEVLLEEIRSNPKWQEILATVDFFRCDEEGVESADLWRRGEAHGARLESGRRVSSYHASDEFPS
jgi:hypothetical protein